MRGGSSAPELATLLAVVVECLGGLLVLAGYHTRAAGLVLAVWCIATALVAHTNFADVNQTIHFPKNLAIERTAAFGEEAGHFE